MIKRLDLPSDRINNTVTYDLGNGQRVSFDRRDVETYGPAAMLKAYGISETVSAEPLAVFQHRRQIGTLPGDFDPLFIKSTSFLYDPRPGDFTRTAEGWEAADNMGPGDFEAIPGFVRKGADDER